MPSTVTLHEIASPHLPAPVPYALLTPEAPGPLPLCLFLLGAGGSREALFGLQSVFDGWWKEGWLPQMTIAVPSGGLDYCLEDRAGTIRWDSFLASDFISAIPHSGRVYLAGISGGGYGALKLAFAHSELFSAVAAMQPMLEPGWHESDVGPRNRLHHSAGGPPQLIGPARDAALWQANNPANRARENAQAIRDSAMAIYLEAADRDFLNAHDGAEFLHRTLWDLDIAHEYRLIRDADHGGPTMRPRLRAMFAWIAALCSPPPADAAMEEAAARWIESGMQGQPPEGATTTGAFLNSLRARFEPLRAKAAETDPTALRRYGKLP